MWSFGVGCNLINISKIKSLKFYFTDELQFVTDGEILFTPESEPSEDNTLTSCAFVAAVDNNQIEPEEVVTLMIDPDSLMPNDRAIDPRIVEIIILNNDGMHASFSSYSYLAKSIPLLL